MSCGDPQAPALFSFPKPSQGKDPVLYPLPGFSKSSAWIITWLEPIFSYYPPGEYERFRNKDKETDLHKHLRANTRHPLLVPFSALPFPALSLIPLSFLPSPSSSKLQEPVPSPALFQKPLEAARCEGHSTFLRGGVRVNELTQAGNWDRERQKQTQRFRVHADTIQIVESPNLLPWLPSHCPLPPVIMTETLGMSISEKLPWTSGRSGGGKHWGRMQE